MRVVVVPADRGGCGYYRLIWPAQAVSAVRPDWEIEIRPPEKVEAGFVDDRLVGVRGLDPLPDVLVMQRTGTPGQLAVLQWAQERGVAVVVDFDDAMWCIDRGNTAWSSWNGMGSRGQHWRTCDLAASQADLVTVTTSALGKRYGAHGRFEVVPNCVPSAATRFKTDREDEPFTAGWVGFTKTHPGDCKISAPAAHAVLESGGSLRVIADAAGAAADWDVPLELVDSVPSQRLGPSYYQALTNLDLMLVGLRDTPFNSAKSFLKVLEAGAAGVPAIAPANKPHRDLARTGFPVILAESPIEWWEAAARLAKADRATLQERSATVHQVVQEEWTIEGNAERWAQAWERAYRRVNKG